MGKRPPRLLFVDLHVLWVIHNEQSNKIQRIRLNQHLFKISERKLFKIVSLQFCRGTKMF